MKRSLYWTLVALLVFGMLGFFWAVHLVINSVEEQISFIEPAHQEKLNTYAKHAEQLYMQDDMRGLNTWLLEIAKKENTWATVVEAGLNVAGGSPLPESYMSDFGMGRGVDWKVHFTYNYVPTIGYRFAKQDTHFIIGLPSYMMPGKYWEETRLTLHFLLPALVLLLVAHLLYKYIMVPLRTLQRTTQSFAAGHFDARVGPALGKRNDELASIAKAFDNMADRTQALIETQRLLLADLSHEMRTPIARLELALENQKNGKSDHFETAQKNLEDLRRLASDALTLAWLETEQPRLKTESLDLVDLLDCIIEGAVHEYAPKMVATKLPEYAPIKQSNHRALGQAFENIIRNALKYSPNQGQVTVDLDQADKEYRIRITDNGPGVPEEMLDEIFKPFFRVDKSRGDEAGGFGLGLSLAKRQIEAVGGSIRALNATNASEYKGLSVEIVLPQ